jgi:hypothetical protein
VKLFEVLNEDNFLLYAANNYRNRQCSDAQEFYDDLNRFKYIKRLISRYKQSGELQERLLINHIVILANVFGIEAAVKMLWYKINNSSWHIIKPILIYLDYIHEDDNIEVGLDQHIVEKLRQL